MSDCQSTVQAANLLTRQWVHEQPGEENSAVSGVGVWILLVALLEASTGATRAELEHAVSVDGDHAANAVNEQLNRLALLEGVSNAVGLWLNPNVPLRAEFRDAMRRMTVDSLPADIRDLDSWANDRTSGLIPTFPGAITEDTELILASALAMEADWVTPFQVGTGKWQGRDQRHVWLRQTTNDRDRASILRRDTQTVGRVTCPTQGGFEVHLLSGSSGDAPGDVLGVGIDALCGEVEELKGSELAEGDVGGCLSVRMERSFESDSRLVVALPPFEIRCSHDLLADARLFGLETALDRTEGHFPGLSTFPLAVESASQSVMAAFSDSGFRAAAVSAVMGVAAGLPQETALVVHASFDRPFGFLVVDPSSQLVLIAGWVAEPSQASPE